MTTFLMAGEGADAIELLSVRVAVMPSQCCLGSTTWQDARGCACQPPWEVTLRLVFGRRPGQLPEGMPAGRGFMFCSRKQQPTGSGTSWKIAL